MLCMMDHTNRQIGNDRVTTMWILSLSISFASTSLATAPDFCGQLGILSRQGMRSLQDLWDLVLAVSASFGTSDACLA